MTQDPLPSITWRYVALEHDVQRLINDQCSMHCALCTACCCRADICEEALDSAFLRHLHGQQRHSITFSERFGWLTEYGCSLPIGRPPVCYEFFCDDLLARQPGEDHCRALKTLGALLNDVGRNALGAIHLVEITREEDLHRLSAARFQKQMTRARAAFDHLQFFFENGFFDDNAESVLRTVQIDAVGGP